MSDALLEAVEGLHVSELELVASRQAAARQAAARQAAGPWRGLSRPRQAAATNEVREAALVDKQAAPRGDSGSSTSASPNEEEGGAAAPAEGRSGRLEIRTPEFIRAYKRLEILFLALPIELIAQQIDEDDRLAAALSCHALRDAVRRGAPPRLQLKTRVASAVKSLERLKWSLAVGCPRQRLCEHAAALPSLPDTRPVCMSDGHGRLLVPDARLVCMRDGRPLIEFMRLVDGTCPWGATCDAAAARADMSMVEWAHAHGAPWGPSTAAALASHPSAFLPQRRLLATGYVDGDYVDHTGDETPSFIESAFRTKVEYEAWLRAQGSEAAPEPIDNSPLYRLLALGCPADSTCCAAAATVHGELQLNWLRTVCELPWDERTCTALAEAGNTKTLTWAQDEGCPCDAAKVNVALAHAAGAGKLDLHQLLCTSTGLAREMHRVSGELHATHTKLSAVEAKAKESAKNCEAAILVNLSTLPPNSRYQKTRAVELADDDPTRAHLIAEFLKSCTRHRGPRQGDPYRGVPMFEVQRVEQLHNPRLQEKYMAELQDIAGLCEQRVKKLPEMDAARHTLINVETFQGLKLNERLLYHGAPSNLIERLRLQGLDPRRAGGHFGKLYGSAVYLAANSSKSDIYTEPNAAGERCVLVVRACLGEAHLAKKAMPQALMPPERPDGRGPLNSVLALTQGQGGVVEHPEYMVYKDSQCLPMFAIWYKHGAACGCTHCC